MINRKHVVRVMVFAAVIAVTMFTVGAFATAADDPPSTSLSGQVDLPRLVDLCAERLGLNIEYDSSVLRGAVTLRLGAGVSDEELWLLTNRVLASRGFTSVQMPGEDMLSIVKLSDAPGMARVEGLYDQSTRAGYVTAIARVEHQRVADVLAAAKLVMSRTGSAATRLGDSDLIVLSDLKPRVDEAMQVIRMLDTRADAPRVETIPTHHLAASQLAPLVTRAASNRDSMTSRSMKGTLTPVPDDNAVVVIAPPGEFEQWLALIEQFDEREAVESRGYAPERYSVDEVSQLIEQTARTPSPRGSGDRWNVVADDLSGTLVVTATPHEHGKIERLLDRLQRVPRDARRPVRAFPIRNRSVTDMVDVLSRLIDAGVLDTGGRQDSNISFEDRTDPGYRAQADNLAQGQSDERSMRDDSVDGDDSRRRPRSTPERLVLTADEGTNTLIATGEPRMLGQVEELIRTLDVRQRQVMIEVLVVSLTESQSVDLGAELQKLEISGNTIVQLSSLFGLGSPGLGSGDLPSGGGGFSGVALSPGDFSVLVRALQTVNNGRTLTMPKVLVNNNQEAMVDSVLQEPFTSLNALDTVATTSFGGTLDAGTIVTVVPQITEGDHLTLEYGISLSTFVGESTDAELPPPRQQNRLQSIVTIPDGYTIVVGGLEVTSESQAVSQIPLLGDVPLLGEVFKSRSNSTSRQRFFVFIRSNILRGNSFASLKYMSDRDVQESSASQMMQDWPDVKPQVIR